MKLLFELGIAKGFQGKIVVDFMRKQYSQKQLDDLHKAFGYVEEIKKLSQELIVILLPTREQVEERRRERVLKQLGLDVDEFDYSSANEKWKVFLNTNHIEYFDLASDFILKFKENHTPLYYIIDGHFNVNGNAFMAETLYRYLSPKFAAHQIKNGLRSDKKF